MVDPFKICPCCSKAWMSRNDFLEDDSLILNGYASDLDELLEGLFFFTHHVPGCFSTLTIKAKSFADLYTGHKYSERKIGGEDCPSYCLDKEQLSRCDAMCECAYVREILNVVREYPKQPRTLA